MKTERQQEILEISLDLINKKGIQGLTIKNLSRRIGISEPAIYRHFDSKIDILIAILDIFKSNSSKLFDREVQNQGTTIEKIEHLFQNHFSVFAEKPSLTSVIFSEEIFRNEPALRDKIAEVIEHNNEILVAIITSGQQKNEIRNDIAPENLAIVVMGTLRLFIKKWQFSSFSFNLSKEGEKVIQMIKLIIQKS